MAELKLTEDEKQRIVSASHHAPRSVLGFHEVEDADGARRWVVRVLEPAAERVTLLWDEEPRRAGVAMQRIHPEGLFEAVMTPRAAAAPYRLEIFYRDGRQHVRHDPYYFAPQITDFDLYLFGQGKHHQIYYKLGAHPSTQQGVEGTLFAVWAPAAARVSIVGEFNHWDGRKHAMQSREASGIWELFIPGLGAGTLYKYELRGRDGRVLLKADPYGFAMQRRPENCSVVADLGSYEWGDEEWMKARAGRDVLAEPINIYEVHLGSWKRIGEDENRFLSYEEAAADLIPYVKDMGYTHIELMGVAEHPFDGSWGYQVVGYYAANSRFGSPQGLMYFIDCCHRAGIGVIMDWVPAHFPVDEHGLGMFDGTCLYEHADPRQGEHKDWGTKIFNFGRNEVRNFLISNALFWLEYYHIDGLRVDAVASMLYLDYSREPDEWVPNEYGGRENLEAITFLKALNETIFRYYPGILSIAEESTAFPAVSHPTYAGGLGFNMKWNMGWMNDTLRYVALDPVYRKYESHLVTFSLMYAFSEKFLLPVSHDEVVHGKGSLLAKMPGDDWQKRAGVRLFLSYMIGHPGKKLLFMGSEFGQWREWTEAASLDWHLLEQPEHRGLQEFVRTLNHFYRASPVLYTNDFDHSGFEWIEYQDHDNSVYSFLRRGREPSEPMIFVYNFTPIPREHYLIGVPAPGRYEIVLDSDEARFGGSGYAAQRHYHSEPEGWHGRTQRLRLRLPPLAALALRRVEGG